MAVRWTHGGEHLQDDEIECALQDFRFGLGFNYTVGHSIGSVAFRPEARAESCDKMCRKRSRLGCAPARGLREAGEDVFSPLGELFATGGSLRLSIQVYYEKTL
jgi:hypothetical protein